ncbi:MAG: zinc ribbon domain-containing protein [Myxococcales bacterium]|nr:zinc ribbon domain-containing protein [Myxococcales bacterium]
MPIYRYQCEACSQTTDVFAKMSDPPPATCPHCGGGPLVKAVARTAFHLKGGGWYAQGYGASAQAGTATGAASGGSGGSGGSGDAGSTSSTSKDAGPKAD